MKDYYGRLTGIIECEEGNLVFSENNYCFTFMNADFNTNGCTLAPKGQFIYGKAHDYHPIAIAYGERLCVRNMYSIKTNTFVVGDCNVEDYSIDRLDYLVFIGGTLNSVFPIKALKENLDSNPECSKIEYDVLDDKVEFSFVYNNEEYKANIESTISLSCGIEGTSLKNDKVIFSLKLPKEVDINDAYWHIAKIKEVLSILTFRRNVGFDEIIIGNSNNKYNQSHLYIREEQEITKKKAHFNVKFTDIKNCLPCLFETIYNNSEKKTTYDFGMIPENDKEAIWARTYNVKNVASALECEYGFLDIHNKPDEQLEKLIESAEKLVKEYKENNDSLDEQTYSRILSNIGYWSLTFGDKLNQMVELFSKIKIISNSVLITDKKAIPKFVKFRNDITHGRSRIMSSDMADTYFALTGLACCCFFKRIGVDDDTISELITDDYLTRT